MKSGIMDELECKRLGLEAKICKLKAQWATGLSKSRLLIESRIASLQQKEIEDRLYSNFSPEKEASDASKRDNNKGSQALHAVCILLFQQGNSQSV